MIKFSGLIFILFAFCSSEGFDQFASDGSYIWNSTSITYSVNDKTDMVISNKGHYSNLNDRLDYFHFDLIAYHKITKKVHQKTRPTWEWKGYNVFGVNTKVRI